MASEYPKTENLFTRDEIDHKLNLGDYRRDDFRQIGLWPIVTEKIDGTNVRLILTFTEGVYVSDVRGRSDAATLPKNFVQEALGVENAYDLTDPMFNALKAIVHGGESDDELTAKLLESPLTAIAFGEGYGPGIQKGGGNYAPKKSLRLFDVVTFREGSRPLWRTWDDVETFAHLLGLKTVPLVDCAGADTDSIVEWVREGVISRVAGEEGNLEPGSYLPAEGIVARTDPYLYDYRGNRVMFKLKGKDLP